MIKSIVWILILIIPTTLFGQDLSKGLVGYYPLGGSYNDFSGKGYHGTPFSLSKTSNELGISDSATNFNGSSSYLSIGDKSDLGLSSGSFSLCAKFKTSTTATMNLAEKLHYTNNVVESGWAFGINPDKAQFVVYTGLGFGAGTPRRYVLLSTNVVNDGKWHSLVVTYDPNEDTLRMYVDCALNSKLYCPYNPGTNSRSLCLGRRDIDANLYWNGSIDEFRFYNRALTEEEVRVYAQHVIKTSPLGSDTTICSFPYLLHAKNKGLRYKWSTGLNDTLESINVNDTGLYWVDIYGSCATYRDSIKVSGLVSSNLNLGKDTLICPGDSIKLFSNITGSSYLWSDGLIQSERWVKTGGTYSLAVTTNCGLKRDTITIFDIVYSIGPDTTICGLDSIELKGPPGAISYLWSNGKVTQNIYASSAGSFALEANFSCGIIRDTILVTKVEKLNIGIDTVICGPFSRTLNSNVLSTEYLWSSGETTSSITLFQPGIYWLRIKTQCGFDYDTVLIDSVHIDIGNVHELCSNNDSVYLEIYPPYTSILWSTGSANNSIILKQPGKYWVRVNTPCGLISDTLIVFDRASFVLPNDTVLCSGAFSRLLKVDNISGVKYSWNNSLVDTLSTFLITDTGTYYLRVQTSCGIRYDTISISYPPALFDIDSTIFCSLPRYIKASGLYDSYSWNGGPFQSNDSFLVTVAGIYKLTGSINGCIKEDSIVVIQPNFDVFVEGDTLVCSGRNVKFYNSIGYPVVWNNSFFGDTFTFVAANSGWIRARVDDPICGSKTDSIYLTVVPTPQAIIDVDPEIGGTIPITVRLKSLGQSDKVKWIFGNGVDSNQLSEFEYVFDDTAKKKITLFVYNELGCWDSVSYTLPLSAEFYLRFPNAFTPNGDGINDSFEISYKGISDLNYSIYNRWGQLIFESRYPNIVWWDGSYRGTRVAEGVYFVILEYQRPNEPKKLLNGTITLLNLR